MNRIDRITAILIQLQSKKVVKAPEIADRFDISLRTVYRDIRTLEEAGVPIYSEPGKGYSLVEGYHLPPVRFTKDEATALLMSEKLVDGLTDKSVSKHVQNAMFKIKSVLRSEEKEHLEKLAPLIRINPSSPEAGTNGYKYIHLIQIALIESRTIHLDYYSVSKNETTSREILPVSLFYYASKWHVIGFCKLREDYRDFRLDKIQHLNILENKFDASDLLSIDDYILTLANSRDLLQVKVQFSKKIAQTINEQKYYFGYIREKDAGDMTEMDFATDLPHYFGKWLLTFGSLVRVTEPESFKVLMQQLAEELYKHWND
jgi:predicted DNA-binding transcriptional regulator YafY